MRCTDCGKDFDPSDSLMGDLGQCQECWEAQCSEAWWLAVARCGAESIAMNPVSDEQRTDVAAFLCAAGVRPKCSTGQAGEITRGYGRLDIDGYWEWPLLAEVA